MSTTEMIELSRLCPSAQYCTCTANARKSLIRGSPYNYRRPHKALHPVCLSVRHVPTIYSKSESRINYTFRGDMTTCTRNMERKFAIKKWKIKATGNENVKFVFHSYHQKSGSIYVKPRPKWFLTHSTRIIEYNQRKRVISVIFVHRIFFVYSKLERRRNFIFYGEVIP